MNAPGLRIDRAVAVASGDPVLRSLVTVVPEHVLPQSFVRDNAKAFFGPRSTLFEHLEPVFGNAQIERRYACQPPEWYLTPRDFGEKSAGYAEHAIALGLGGHGRAGRGEPRCRRHRCDRHHLHHRHHDAKPRRAPYEPASLPPRHHAPADLRLRLRGRRARPDAGGATRALAARDAGARRRHRLVHHGHPP